MSLHACSVSYSIGGHCLLERFELEIEIGEIVMLVGNNGAGKSTALNLLAGCPQPSTGEVMLESRPLTEWAAGELAARRAILPQSSSLAFDFTAAEVVALGAPSRALRAMAFKQHVHDAMERMDVAQFADRGYFSLSGGERQRVHLARVFLQISLVPSVPRYLLLDEPLVSLDLAHQYAVLDQLRRLAAVDVGIVFVTHDLNIARRYASRVCLLKAGRCYAQGAAADIITATNIRAVFGVEALVARDDTVVTRPLEV